MAEAGRGMTAPPPPRGPAAAARDPWVLCVALVCAFLAVRVAALFLSPLELYPDEAQYWVWSRKLGLGYFSKPPLIAWAIRATTALGDQAEPWVRLSAPLFHAAAALALARAGRRLYGPWAGFWAAVIYSLMPGVQLSSAVIATDAPLMAFLALAVWAYAALVTTPELPARRRAAAALGAALGLAMLAKYAAVYVALGLVLHALVSREARRRWEPVSLLLTAGLLVLFLAPNLGWNLQNGLSTLAHTADAADWGQAGSGPAPRSLFDPRQAPGFLLSQFGVFGPVPFAVLLVAGIGLFRRGRVADGRQLGEGRAQDVMLACLAAPALLVALAEAAISRANANWAAAAYAAGSVLAAGWLVRRASGAGARRALGSIVLLQGALAVLFLAGFARPALADRLGLGNSIKQARGWQAATRAVLERASGLPRPDAVAADDRFLYNALAYYGRGAFATPGTPPLRMWVREVAARNEAEATAPLGPRDGTRVLVAAISYPAEAAADFKRVGSVERLRLRLDAKRVRALVLFEGEDFEKKPRDPKTGRPFTPAPPP